MWTMESLQHFLNDIKERTGLDASYRMTVATQGRYPLAATESADELVFVPAFFHHDDLTETDRTMLAVLAYADLYLRQRRPDCVTRPEKLAKGLCDRLGYDYVSVHDLEHRLMPLRPRLFTGAYAARFSVGEEITSQDGSLYRVMAVCPNEAGGLTPETRVTVEHIAAVGTAPAVTDTCTERELYDQCYGRASLAGQPIDLRKNLFILSAPSGCGKNTVFEAVRQQVPQSQRVITATTRAPRRGETDGVDYLFCTEARFDEIRRNAGFVEDVCYDHACYGTPVSEIERYGEDVPVFLIVDVRGKERVMARYPLAHAIFISPPSIEELERRLRSRGDNQEAEIARRMAAARMEMQQARFYEYVVENDDLDACVSRIVRLVERAMA